NHVAARIKDRKCKSRGGSSRPLVKRKFAPGSSTSRATHAKTSSSKDDVPYLTMFDDDEGRLSFFKLLCTVFASWKNHLDNHMDVELLDLHDRCYARQAVVDNAINRRSRELLRVIKKLRGEFDVIKDREEARQEECEELHKVSLDIMILESQKWIGYQQSLLTLDSKVTSLEAKKARLLSSAILYGRSRAYEQVADMKEPFDLSNVKGYFSSYKKDHTQASNNLATTTFP
nr:hypothetical protein [Tanacetum cinerariifolium]